MDHAKRENRSAMLDKLQKLFDDVDSLTDVFGKDGRVSSNDWANMLRFFERIFSLKRLVLVEKMFFYLALDISDVDDDKALFLVEKTAREFANKHLIDSINSLIQILRHGDLRITGPSIFSRK